MHSRVSLRTIQTYLMYTAGILLLIVCLSKLITIYHGSKALSAQEALTGISYAKLLTVISIVEAIIGTAATFFPNARFSVWSVAWLGVLFTGYRLVRSIMGFHGPCKCLGGLFKWWPWGDAHENFLSWGVIVILLVASGICIFSPSTPSGHKEPVT